MCVCFFFGGGRGGHGVGELGGRGRRAGMRCGHV